KHAAVSIQSTSEIPSGARDPYQLPDVFPSAHRGYMDPSPRLKAGDSGFQKKLFHHRDRESVIAFAPDGLDGGSADARFGGKHLVETANALDHGVWAPWIDHGAFAYHVIGHDQAAWTRELQRPGQIVAISFFIGINEDEVERSFVHEGGQGV